MFKNILMITLTGAIMLTGCGDKEEINNNQANQNTEPKVIQCKSVKLPEFTLSRNSNPTEQQVENLCQCLWTKLVGWEKDTVIKIAEGKENEIGAIEMRAFPTRFGKRMEECGAYKL